MNLPELPPDTAPAIREAFEALARESAELRAELDALKGAMTAQSLAPTQASRGATSAAALDRAPPARQALSSAPPPATSQPPADRRRDLPRDAGDVRSVIAPPPRASAHASVNASTHATAPRVDMEKLLGRYGAWAAAALMILLGVGTLLEWAIRNGWFGPAARVAVSVIIAAALAVGGFMLRERAAAAGESRTYGNSCLGLALGVVDVVAWQIGPHWRMVPPGIALILADVGATALVAFGVREDDELLAAAGAAGLYLAPFVTSSGGGSPLVLATYIVLVSLALFRFVEQTTWRVARAVIQWGPILSVVGLIGMEEPVLGAIVASVLALGMLGVDTPVVTRLKIVALYAATAVVATFAVALDVHTQNGATPQAPDWHMAWLAPAALAIVLAVASVFVLRVAEPDGAGTDAVARDDSALRSSSPLSLTFTLLLPIAAVLAIGAALPGDATLNVTWMSEGAGIVALAVALFSDAPLARDYFTTGFMLLWTGTLSYSSRGPRIAEAMLLGTAAVGLGIFTLRRDVRLSLVAAFVSAACVATVSATWMYTAEMQPVARTELDVLLMLGACAALVWIARISVDTPRAELRAARAVTAWAACLVLARHLVVLASGPYTAVALTAFYAAAGVTLIVLGGRRETLGMRRAGLALALYAPLRAIVTASEVENTGMRVAVYFVAGAFMLLVAFLYRNRLRDGAPILADVLTDE